MQGGNIGRVLFVDLSSGAISEEKLEEKLYRDFIGGTGLGARILYERMAPGVDPLGPENWLGFVTGPLTGTAVPSTGRYTVVAKSPLTATWGDANSGGYFGSELKAAGYDAVFFNGISSQPVYLWINDGKAELRDAAHLWGKDTTETEEILCQELGDQAIRVACIGPAGESRSLIAAVINDRGRAAARSGLGAVMGAKRLKAIAVRGNKKVPVADSAWLRALRKEHLKGQKENLFIKSMSTYGTCAALNHAVKTGDAPIRNWSLMGTEAMPGYTRLIGEEVIKYKIKNYTCQGCPIACGGIVGVERGPYAVEEGHKPEFQTVASFGTLCFNDNLESIIKANDICNRYGLDTISAGATIAFATECYERGLIDKKDTGGIELTWGNAVALIAMLEKIARREGFGDVLADGVKVAAERIGHNSEEFAIHIHGQEICNHDPRRMRAMGVSYIGDPTPARHTSAATPMTIADRGRGAGGPYPELQNTEVPADDYENKGKIYAVATDYHQVFTSSGFCEFLVFVGNAPLVEYISAVTGWDFTIEEALVTGRRIQTMRQAFNVREGLQPADFSLPGRIKATPASGPLAGKVVDSDALRDAYYRALGWDVETGRPLEESLARLGLKELVKL